MKIISILENAVGNVVCEVSNGRYLKLFIVFVCGAWTGLTLPADILAPKNSSSAGAVMT